MRVLVYIVTISFGHILYCGCLTCTVAVLTCFVMCGCFGKMYTCIYCVLYCLYCVFCIVSFMHNYSYLFCLYWCKDYCHRVTAQLQLVVVVVVVVVVAVVVVVVVVVILIIIIIINLHVPLCHYICQNLLRAALGEDLSLLLQYNWLFSYKHFAVVFILQSQWRAIKYSEEKCIWNFSCNTRSLHVAVWLTVILNHKIISYLHNKQNKTSQYVQLENAECSHVMRDSRLHFSLDFVV